MQTKFLMKDVNNFSNHMKSVFQKMEQQMVKKECDLFTQQY